MSIIRNTFFYAFVFAAQAVAADTPVVERWVADPAKSSLGFTATQEGAPFDGRFGQYNVGLELVQTENGAELVSIGTIIQLGSVDTQYGERDDYLAQEDWFHIKVFPEARFASETIKQLGNNRFVAEGELSLRGVSQPVSVELQISIDENGERGRLIGSSALKRLDFGVGQGDWENTEWVGDLVEVEFELHILRAFE